MLKNLPNSPDLRWDAWKRRLLNNEPTTRTQCWVKAVKATLLEKLCVLGLCSNSFG